MRGYIIYLTTSFSITPRHINVIA